MVGDFMVRSRQTNMAANNYYGFSHAGAQYGGISSIGGSGLGPGGVSSGTGYIGGTYTSPQSVYSSGQSSYASASSARPSGYHDLYGTRTQTFSPTAGLYDSRDVYYTSAQADTLTPLVQQQHQQQQQQQQHATVEGRSGTSHQQLNIQTSLLSSADDRQGGGSKALAPSDVSHGPPSGSYGMPSYRNDSGQRRRPTNNEGVSYGSWSRKPPNYAGHRPRSPPKPSQLHYCEICKISCAGAQTYMEHLEGKNHKKKESMAKNASSQSGSSTVVARNSKHLYCELCDVVCTCVDTYAAHVRGIKHNKVLSLHQKLGKPIPEQPKLTSDNKLASGASKVTGFVGGGQLKMAGDGTETAADADAAGLAGNDDNNAASDDVQPIGLEYIEEGCNEAGTAASFYCKLCDCHFTDPHAKLMHTKGRRHRQNYKVKVDPSLQVETKVNPYIRRQQLDKYRSRIVGGNPWQKRRLEEIYKQEVEELRYEQERLRWQLNQAAHLGTSTMPSQTLVESAPTSAQDYCSHGATDRYIIAKHTAIYPTSEDLDAVQAIVSACEHALKLISDSLAQKDVKEEPEPEEKSSAVAAEEGSSEAAAASTTSAAAAGGGEGPRELKGVMRVGLLAKGLLLHGDLELQLIVLCHNRPTKALLKSLADKLPAEFEKITEEKYDVSISSIGDRIIVKQQSEPCVTCAISLTSPSVKDDWQGTESNEYLNTQMCMHLLAALRHTKWFRAMVISNETAVMLVRILRDLCHRIPTWQPLGQWALELLVARCLSSAVHQLSPAIGLRLIFESIASGLLLPGGPGLLDPCEKDPIDALACLTQQQREDITNSAQHALRMIVFGDIHKVLGMEPLPSATGPPGQRKRPHANGASAADGLQPN